MTDQEIIHAIRQGKRDDVIRFLYKELPKIKALIAQSGCDVNLANEIFNDSLILFIEKVESPKFELTSKLTTFLYGINRFLVMRAIRDDKSKHNLEWKNTLIVSQEDLEYDFEKEARIQKLEAVIAKVSERCQNIFKLFYFEGKSMEIIAKELDFSSMNSAKTQKYKCLQKALQLAQESPNTLKD